MMKKPTFVLTIVFASICVICTCFGTVFSWAYNDANNLCYDLGGVRFNCMQYTWTNWKHVVCTDWYNVVSTGFAFAIVSDLLWLSVIVLCALALALHKPWFKWITLFLTIGAAVASLIVFGIIDRMFSYSMCGGPAPDSVSFAPGPAYAMFIVAGCIGTVASLFHLVLPAGDDAVEGDAAPPPAETKHAEDPRGHNVLAQAIPAPGGDAPSEGEDA